MTKELYKRLFTSLILFFTSFFVIMKGSYYFIFFILVIFILSSIEWYNLNNKKITYVLGLFFLIFSFYTAFIIRFIDVFFFLFIILISILSDIGGFSVGKLFKGPKLTKISPNKTVSGMFGSFVLSLIGSLTFIYHFSEYSFFLRNTISEHPIIYALMISLISQLGDLLISLFKRLKKIKDTGKILPGHGGILDRIDGLIFVIPFGYLLYHLF